MIDHSLYIVDDEDSVRQGIAAAFEKRYRIRAFPDAESAIGAVKENPPDLVLLDIGLPGMDGIEALKVMRGDVPDLLVVVITAYEDVRTVVAAMKGGAHDYVVKPLQMETLEVTVRNALDTLRLKKEVQDLQARYLQENVPCFIAESDAIQEVMGFVETIARSPDTPVLIVGETGTGKELIAGAIHFRSPNFRGPFVTVNCASIPLELVESELFGYEKGAFTGASASGKKGLVEQAAGGTLFLDEVGDLSLEAQAKLLRFLEEGEFYRVGGTKALKVSTRVVSATNKDLQRAMTEERRFREDLYYRLSVVKVALPSLNARREDIVPIARHFLLQFARKFGKVFTGISPEAEETLRAHDWKGNVRELRNAVERGALTGKGPILAPADLGLAGPARTAPTPGRTEDAKVSFPPLPAGGVDLPALQQAMEKFYIEEALRLSRGNESGAARLLNLNHHTFRYRSRRLKE